MYIYDILNCTTPKKHKKIAQLKMPKPFRLSQQEPVAVSTYYGNSINTFSQLLQHTPFHLPLICSPAQLP